MDERRMADCMLKCIVELREYHRMSWSGARLVCDSVYETLDIFIHELEKNLAKRAVDPSVLSKVKQEARHFIMTEPLKEVSTEHRVMKCLREVCGLVDPVDIEMGINHNITLSEHSEDINDEKALATFVPFSSQLSQLLKNCDFYELCFDKTAVASTDSTIRNIRDGSYVKNHPIYIKYPDCLLLQMYEDDVEIANPLGAHTKVHKITAIYWQILNLPDHVRSNLASINLLGFARSNDIKTFGFEVILNDFFNCLNKLGSPEGLDLDIGGGKTRNFHGFLVCINGDSLALNALGGFKEAFSFAAKPCRSCDLSQEEMRNIFHEVRLRDLSSYKNQVKMVTDETIPKNVRSELSKNCGINSKSVLENLSHFDPTQCLVQDFMHSFLEGALEVEIRALLFELVEEKKLLSYDDLNYLLGTFPYPSNFTSSKPSNIERIHVVAGKLRQNASQMITLMYILPFLVEPYATGDTYEHVQTFSLLAKIGNILMAYEIDKCDLDMVRNMIQDHHCKYKNLFNNFPMTPKYHFLVHLPTVIERFGPIRVSWTMRYEALNAWVTKIGEETRNFRHITNTLATRFQVRKCLDYGFGDPNAKVLSAKTFCPEPGQIVDLSTYPLGLDVAREMLTSDLTRKDSISETSAIHINNFEIKINSYLLIENIEMEMPKFGQVKAIFVEGEKCVFVFQTFETLLYNQTTNTYEVAETNQYTCLAHTKVPYLHSLPCVRRKGKISLFLQYHSRNEYVGI